MSAVSTIRMTAQQFLQLGEDPPGVRLELVDGEIAASPSPAPGHSIVDRRLSRILHNYIIANDLGELIGDVDTIFGLHDVRRPDIIYFTKARLHLVGETAIEGPPDLCVEIISPSSVRIDRRDKFEQYQAAGVQNYWIVDPAERTIEAFALDDGRYRLASRGTGAQTVHLPPFPELAIPLGTIWYEPRV